jgi:hypothetical protein
LSTNWIYQNGFADTVIPTMLDREAIRKLVQRALDEDLPDITAEAIFEPAERGFADPDYPKWLADQ